MKKATVITVMTTIFNIVACVAGIIISKSVLSVLFVIALVLNMYGLIKPYEQANKPDGSFKKSDGEEPPIKDDKPLREERKQ